MTKKEGIAGGFLVLSVALVVGAFLAGPLFPWAPVRFGYAEQQTTKAVVISPSHRPLPLPLVQLDMIIGQVEEQTGFWLETPLRIVVSGDWGLFYRGALKGILGEAGAVSGATLPTGTVIYLSPRVFEPGQSPIDLLQHEVLHAAAYQQMSLYRSLAFRKIHWLNEGLAEHLGATQQELDNATWGRLATAEAYLYPVATGTAPERIPEEEREAFIVASQRQFVRYLQTRFGSEVFYLFVRGVMAAPDQLDGVFRDTFGISLSDADAAFMREVQAGIWPPVY